MHITVYGKLWPTLRKCQLCQNFCHRDNMQASSYLFTSKRKRINTSRIMEKHSSSSSNISMDSLEQNFLKKTSLKSVTLDENVDTILVPFYEKDVLIKVPKDTKKKQKHNVMCGKTCDRPQQGSETSQKSYLVNKDRQKAKCTYLEMFRKQFTSNGADKKPDENEIRSLSPEFGDTERESIGEDANNPVSEFFNTESYNEVYYEKLLNRDLEQYLDNSFEGFPFTGDVRSKLPADVADDNFRSISEVSQPRRRLRRATVQPIQTVKLGGLGPDMERIKPRLERARSLQRYSEKVRMENRLKIYKKSVQEDNDKKAEKESVSARQRETAKEYMTDYRDEQTASYLVNKLPQEKTLNVIRKIYSSKSKSAGVQRTQEKIDNSNQPLKYVSKRYDNDDKQKRQGRNKKGTDLEEIKKADLVHEIKMRVRSSAKSKGINTEDQTRGTDVPPVQINFMVNVGGVRPSSALRKLEEKHRMYQEQVKSFSVDHTNI